MSVYVCVCVCVCMCVKMHGQMSTVIGSLARAYARDAGGGAKCRAVRTQTSRCSPTWFPTRGLPTGHILHSPTIG